MRRPHRDDDRFARPTDAHDASHDGMHGRVDRWRSRVFGPPRCTDVPQRPCAGLYLYMAQPTRNPTEPTDTKARPLLVSIRQAAEMLSLSRSSIYLLIDSDQLTPIRIGRSVRFTVEQLEQFVANRVLLS
jgi:excisionase family DNA binding protein